MKNKIILLGYMGCGKSTIAKRLAKITTIPFLDLDKCIEVRAKMTISKIFKKHGEIYFRKLEREVLIEILNSPNQIILGLGGGTPCYSNNHELINNKNITSIYIKGSVETLFERLTSSKNKRPIIAKKSKEELKEFIAKHLFERSYYYNLANFTVNIDGKTKDETTDDILKILA